MNDISQEQIPTDTRSRTLSMKLFGVGNAGVAMIEQMFAAGPRGIAFAAVNADSRQLEASCIQEKILIEKKMLRGMGTGGDPERAQAAAEEHLQKLKDACTGIDVVLIVVGLGGGAGTGISPVLARVARETGALTLVLATLPFDCEGNRRQRVAREGFEQLKGAADGVICLPHQAVFKLIDENTSVVDTFRKTMDLMQDAVRGLWRLLTQKGLIEIHIEDLRGLLRGGLGESSVALVETTGKNRANDAVGQLFSHPLLRDSDSPAETDAVLVSLMGGPDLTMVEVKCVMDQINERYNQAQIIMGAAIGDSFRDRLAVTLIASKRSAVEAERPVQSLTSGREFPGLEAQLLEKHETNKPASRFVPPVPDLTPEQKGQLLNKQSGGRQRKTMPRMKQTQLPLEIVNKGRFDKSEPTIYRGEDLDVPTFIRRGIALN